MTTTKNPIPDEMLGAESLEDTSVPYVRQARKARRLRGNTQDESAPGQENLTPDEQPGTTDSGN